METGNNKQKQLIENLPVAFAYHRRVTDDKSSPEDYIFLEVNNTFEKLSGLKRSEVVGKKVTEVYPKFIDSSFDWIETYGQVAQSGEAVRFEYYAKPSQRWYDVVAYSDEPGCFGMYFHDITDRKQSEEALHKSKESYLSMFEKAPICYQSLDESGNFLMVNQAWLDTLGYRKEEVLGKWFGNFLAPEHIETFRQRFPAFKKAGQTEAEFVMIHKNGQRRFVYFKGRIGYKADGSFERTHCVFQDITEQKEAEETIKQREAELATIYENTPLVMMLVDKERKIHKINGYGTSFAGKPEEEMLGKRGGEALGCLYALDDPEGCGKGPHCEYCTVRLTVLETFKTGQSCHQVEASLPFLKEGKEERMHFLLSTVKVNLKEQQMVLVCLQDNTNRKNAERTLHKTQFTVDKSPFSIFWITPEGKFTYVNETAVEKLGYTHEELLSMHVWDVDPKYPQEKRKEQWTLHQREQKRVVESDHRRRDGTTFPVRINIYHLVFEGQEMEIAVVEDITDRKKAEKKLKKIEWMLSPKQTPANADQVGDHDQGYGDLTELNKDGIILNSIGSELLRSFSNDYMELLGTSSAIYEINGDYAFGIFSSGWCRMMDRASRELCNTQDNAEALNSGRWLCHESCWTHCSKEAILRHEQVDIECNGGIRLYAVPIFASGEVVGSINFGYGDPPEGREKLQELAENYQINYDDLVREAQAYETRPPYIIEMAKNRLHTTARLIGSMIETKQAEKAISKSEEKYRRLFETMAQGVIYQAADGKLISANPAAERILGLSFEQMQGKTSMDPRWQMIEEDGTPVPGTEHPAMIALRTGQTVGPVTRGIYRPDLDRHVWLNITAIPLFQPGEDKPFQAYATFSDITGQKQAEQEIRKLNEELEERVRDRTAQLKALNEELASFAYSVSHDLRAPLRAIDGFSASLNETYDDQLDEKGRHYLGRIRNAAGYMSDLIDDLLGLSRITRAEFNPQEVDLSRLAEDITQLMQETEPQHRVEVKIEPGLTARGDRNLLRAVLDNLLGNAWKFSANEEKATIEVGRTTIGSEEVFFVSDNGAGFNMAYADKLFIPFQRLHGKDEFPGTGIGLATVQRIINRHGGRIWAESEEGKGATFYFTLSA